MNSDETILLIRKLMDSHPKHFFQQFDHTNAGIGCVLRCLAEKKKPVSAREISNYMHVSTARVAVLLRKMSDKQLIEVSPDPKDARKVMVTLSQHGIQKIEEQKQQFITFMSEIIETIGKERFELFVEISNEIKAAMDQNQTANHHSQW